MITGSSSRAESRVSWVLRVAERALFARRSMWLLGFSLVSLFLLLQALQLRPDAGLQKMVPAQHPFVVNYFRYENELRPMANTIRIAVETTRGDIYTREYLQLLKQVSDEVFYIPGIDRGNLRSLWTPNTSWFEAAEDGLRSGRVVPASFQGSATELAAVKDNVAKAGLMGILVADDQRSSVIFAPLLENDPETGARLDYGRFSQQLEERVRAKFEGNGIKIHVVGFGKLVGDLIQGAKGMGLFFLVTVLLTTALVYVYSRCWRVTLVTIGCCLLAVIWHLGVMRSLGFGLDPYSMLVPFLTFAIGVSHAMQNVNAFAHASLAGEGKLAAARASFRLLFVPGTVALLCNVVGFSTMLMIDIGVIRELAISASVGVGVIIFTKMFLLPILMSYAGLSPSGRRAASRREGGRHRLAGAVAALAVRRNAVIAVGVAAALAAWGYGVSRNLEIGDLDAGAPELRAGSPYNRDSAYLAEHYATSADVLVAIVKTPTGECGSYPVASTVTRLQWALEETPGVQSTLSLFDVMKQVIAGSNGGNLKWATVTRNRFISNGAHKSVPQSMYNTDCSMLPVIAYLTDHKARTIDNVVQTIAQFRKENQNEHAEILLAAGNAGIEAATNSVVRQAWMPMLLMVYSIVAVLLYLEFRSLRVMMCVLVPLLISSVLCEALMTMMGLGVKVATLPVITLGVGIGVDYGIYLYNRLDGLLEEGRSLRSAYFETMRTTGLAIVFTGITLACGVLTWIFSDIKFQADMGLLLTFMFLWNMLGSVILIPALAALVGVGRHMSPKG